MVRHTHSKHSQNAFKTFPHSVVSLSFCFYLFNSIFECLFWENMINVLFLKHALLFLVTPWRRKLLLEIGLCYGRRTNAALWCGVPPTTHTHLRDLGWDHKCWTLCRPLQFSRWFANFRKPKPGEWWWAASRCSDNHVFAEGWMCSKFGVKRLFKRKKKGVLTPSQTPHTQANVNHRCTCFWKWNYSSEFCGAFTLTEYVNA